MRKQLSEIVSILRGAALERPLQSIISDLEEKKEEIVRGGGKEVRALLERGLRRESVRGERRKVKTKTKGLSSGSVLDSSSSSLNSIRAGQKYQGRRKEEERRTRGRREEEEDRRRGGRREDKPPCDCGPVLERIGKTIEKDRAEILQHIDLNNGRINTRLDTFEKKTKGQMFSFNQNTKESFAEERNDCQERMERRFLKDNIELERQQAIRDIMVKRDIARWLQVSMVYLYLSCLYVFTVFAVFAAHRLNATNLNTSCVWQARLAEIEKRHGLEAEGQKEAVRRITRRRSRQGLPVGLLNRNILLVNTLGPIRLYVYGNP